MAVTKGIASAVAAGAVIGFIIGGVFETVAGGIVLGCGIVAATVWSYVAEHQGWRERVQFTGIFAVGGGALSVAAALGKPSVLVGACFGLFAVLLSVIVWFTAEGGSSDLGGPTD
ncbi:hypothetical protein ABNF97_00570 [Plantactinospora sp. B6F1]|uniref:hypothetical protein n=1 Tax=Plantactinospora sp. B6F1 TaxID=3158971 RepID=UPI00102AA016